MKKLALIIVLTVSMGLVAGAMVDQASAFGFFGGRSLGGYGCGYSTPYYYGIMPYWGYGCGYGGYGGYWGGYWGGKRYGKRAGAPKGPGAPMKK